jgi:hypothetical protein
LLGGITSTHILSSAEAADRTGLSAPYVTGTAQFTVRSKDKRLKA